MKDGSGRKFHFGFIPGIIVLLKETHKSKSMSASKEYTASLISKTSSVRPAASIDRLPEGT